MHYWRCSTSSDCITTGIREDRLKEITASVMGLSEHDAEAFKKQVKYISVSDDMELTFHFFDDTEPVIYITPSAKAHLGLKKGTKNSRSPCRVSTPMNAEKP